MVQIRIVQVFSTSLNHHRHQSIELVVERLKAEQFYDGLKQMAENILPLDCLFKLLPGAGSSPDLLAAERG